MPRWMREGLPIVAGLFGGISVVAAAVAAVVTFGGLIPGASPSPSVTAGATPTPTPTPVGLGSPSSAPVSSLEVGLQPGQLAPPLEVDRLGGDTINLASLRGQAVWLAFVSSRCLPCRQELPLIERYWTLLQGQGLTIVAIDVNETKDTAAAFMAELGITLPVGVDPTSTTRANWGLSAMPAHFWIDSEGVVRGSATGEIGAAQMEAGVLTVLPSAVFTTPAPSVPPGTSSPVASPSS